MATVQPITATSVVTEFSTISERLNADTHAELLSRIITLCTLYSYTLDDLVSQYDTFKFTKQIKQQRGSTSINSERLDLFESYIKSLQQQNNKPQVSTSKLLLPKSNIHVKTIHNTIDIDDELDDMLGISGNGNGESIVKHEIIDDDMINDNESNTMKLTDMINVNTNDKSNTYKTPHNNKIRSFATPATITHNTMFSPITPSTIPLQSSQTELNDKYTQRDNSGVIEYTYNDSIAAAEPIMNINRAIDIHIINTYHHKFRYMYVDDEELQDTMNQRYNAIQSTLCQTVQYKQLCDVHRLENQATVIKTIVKQEVQEEMKTNDDNPEPPSQSDDMPALQADDDIDVDYESYLVPVNTRSQSSIIVAGRIVSDDIDNSTGRLTTGNILLEGDLGLSHGKRVNLRLGLMPQYSLYSGQYCIIRGMNETGHTLIAENILSSAVLQHNIHSPQQLHRYNLCTNDTYQPLSIICGAGPYTVSDTFSYQPLYDLLDRVVTQRPHVLILCGPFIDSEHSAICDNKNENYVTQSYDTIFYTLIDTVLQRIADIHTRLIIIPSVRDISHSVPCYPQPAYTAYQQWQSSVQSGKLLLCCNPSTIVINDITIGVSSSDCLQQLAGQYELSKTDSLIKPNRISRLFSHLLQQQSYYPVYPSTTQSVDYTLAHRFHMPYTPDILILPSKIKYCATDIGDNCIGINCESVAKGTIAGFYTQITIHTLKENEIETATEHNHILARTRIDVIRV